MEGSHFKPYYVYAQEFSHIIGMIHQREPQLDNLDEDSKKNKRIIPLLSISQNNPSIIIAEYDSAYYDSC